MISRQQLIEFLQSNGALPFDRMIGDGHYSTPSSAWIVDEFSQSLLSVQRLLGVGESMSESNDCDDYTRLACALAQTLHNKTRPGKSGLAIGEFWYYKDSGIAHALCVCVVLATSGALRIAFYEPQTRKIVQLSQTEIESCSGIRF